MRSSGTQPPPPSSYSEHEALPATGTRSTPREDQAPTAMVLLDRYIEHLVADDVVLMVILTPVLVLALAMAVALVLISSSRGWVYN